MTSSRGTNLCPWELSKRGKVGGTLTLAKSSESFFGLLITMAKFKESPDIYGNG